MLYESYFVAQYENWTTVLRRIKEDEQRWISVLLILYGAILFFLISEKSEILQFNISHSYSIFGLLLVSIVNLVIALTWSYQSMNLRFQYYRSLIEITKLRIKFKEELESAWYESDFAKWRAVVTRPYESKIVDFLLLSGLTFITQILALYKYGGFNHSEPFWITLFQFKVLLFVRIYSLITIIPFLMYEILDYKKLESIFKNHKLPFLKNVDC